MRLFIILSESPARLSKHEKERILPSLVDPVSSPVPVRYLDTRNILSNPIALPNKVAARMLDSAPCTGHGGRGSYSQKW